MSRTLGSRDEPQRAASLAPEGLLRQGAPPELTSAAVSRLRLILLALVLVVVAAGCEMTAKVAIDVEEDGSGTVVVTAILDRDAAARLGDPATALRLDDLRQAGWRIDDPAQVDGGGLRLVGSRDFASPEQLPGVLDEIGGADGVFRGAELTIADGFSATTYDFTTSVELTGSLEQFSDPDLAAALGGLPLARSPEELAVEGANDPAAARLDVVVDLPGGTPETNGEVRDDTSTWSFSASSGEPTSEELRSTASTSGGSTMLWVGVAAVAAIAAIALLIMGLLARRGR